jgi:hypothetical protein
MNSLKIILLFPLLTFYSFSQQDSTESDSESEEEESAAADAIAGSVSTPNSSPSGSIESNPLIDFIRKGGDMNSLQYAWLFSLPITDLDLLDAALEVAKMFGISAGSEYQTALTEAALLANTLLVDRTITSTATIPTAVSTASFTAKGYNVAFLHLLSKYGAVGSNGDSLVKGLFSDAKLNDSITSLSGTSDYLSYLATLTGSTTFGKIDKKSNVLNVRIENTSITPGKNVTVGIAGTKSTIDVSEQLPSAGGIDENRRVFTIGAVKDMSVAGDVTFTNSNDAEDHALVLAAADDFSLNNSKLTYTGSNLGIAGADTLILSNTSITTGGNLAVGSLGSINISTVDINVGNGGNDSDPDNVYIYANDLININGLSFSGSRLDDVYMEAITVNLNNVAFPSTADVILKSRDGTLHFDTYSSPVVGGVNLTKVKHGDTTLKASHFDGIPGHHDSSIQLPNGKAAVKIRKQY